MNFFDNFLKIIILINNLNSCVFQINVQIYQFSLYLLSSCQSRERRRAIRHTGVLDRMINDCCVYRVKMMK